MPLTLRIKVPSALTRRVAAWSTELPGPHVLTVRSCVTPVVTVTEPKPSSVPEPVAIACTIPYVGSWLFITATEVVYEASSRLP